MRHWIGFVVATTLAASPVRAEEGSTSGSWLRSELAVCGLAIALGETGQLAAADASSGNAPKGRLDDFYPGTLPEQRTFDERRLDAFYPEGASKESEAGKTGLSRGARIGIGVGISVLVVGAAVGGGMAAFARNIGSSGQ